MRSGVKSDDVAFSLNFSKPQKSSQLARFGGEKLYFDSLLMKGSGLGYLGLKEKYAPRGAIKTDESGAKPSFEILLSAKGQLVSAFRRRDPWIMREAFFTLDQSSEALARFLGQWGDWVLPAFMTDLNIDLLEQNYDEAPVYVVPDVVWKQREEYKEALAAPPHVWMSRGNCLPAPHSQLKPPYFAMSDRTCSSAIETTITLDHLRGIPYRFCERTDCGDIFTVESRHERKFCSQACAHLVSVRRAREAKRNSLKKGKR
jgi:hypothetical protein